MIKLQADLSTATAKTEQISWRPTMAVVPVVWWEKKNPYGAVASIHENSWLLGDCIPSSKQTYLSCKITILTWYNMVFPIGSNRSIDIYRYL